VKYDCTEKVYMAFGVHLLRGGVVMFSVTCSDVYGQYELMDVYVWVIRVVGESENG
jgi:hypothetical protein